MFLKLLFIYLFLLFMFVKVFPIALCVTASNQFLWFARGVRSVYQRPFLAVAPLCLVQSERRSDRPVLSVMLGGAEEGRGEGTKTQKQPISPLRGRAARQQPGSAC